MWENIESPKTNTMFHNYCLQLFRCCCCSTRKTLKKLVSISISFTLHFYCYHLSFPHLHESNWSALNTRWFYHFNRVHFESNARCIGYLNWLRAFCSGPKHTVSRQNDDLLSYNTFTWFYSTANCGLFFFFATQNFSTIFICIGSLLFVDLLGVCVCQIHACVSRYQFKYLRYMLLLLFEFSCCYRKTGKLVLLYGVYNLLTS